MSEKERAVSEYARAQALQNLLSVLASRDDKRCDILLAVIKSGRQAALDEGASDEQALFLGHEAAVEYVREHYPDLWDRPGGNKDEVFPVPEYLAEQRAFVREAEQNHKLINRLFDYLEKTDPERLQKIYAMLRRMGQTLRTEEGVPEGSLFPFLAEAVIEYARDNCPDALKKAEEGIS